MTKPTTLRGYTDAHTLDCERLLVTLLRGLGPWKSSVFLIGGLTPRYLVRRRPPAIPARAGTQDVDLVIDLQLLAETEAYQTLEENFKKLGLERAKNRNGQTVSWRWQTHTEHNVQLVLELLTDRPNAAGGKVHALPTDGTISALNIPHAAIVFDLHDELSITAQLLNEDGICTETIRHASLVSFTCLKAFAYDERHERKDAHDLVYCIEHSDAGIQGAADAFRRELDGKHRAIVEKALDVLRRRFTTDRGSEGYGKDGPVSVAKFELGEDEQDPARRESRLLRQRNASELMELLLQKIRVPAAS